MTPESNVTARLGKTPRRPRQPVRQWDAPAGILQVVAHPIRLAILAALIESSRYVKDLNALIATTQPRLSQHLAALRKADLIDCHVDGPARCYYILRPQFVRRLVRLVLENHLPRKRERKSVLREVERGHRGRGGGPSTKKSANRETTA